MQAIDLIEALQKLKEKSPQDTRNFWDLASAVSISVAFLVYITPLSVVLQKSWRTFIPAAPIAEDVAPAVESSMPQLFVGELMGSPKQGEKINGVVVTSDWGDRNTGIPGASKFHEGIDLGVSTGTPVHAIGDKGSSVEVRCWQDKRGGGLVASYKTSWGVAFDYLHLSKCEPGKHKAGSATAASGSTGIGNGAHLHVTQRDLNNKKVPPQRGYLWWIVTGNKP